MIPADAKTDARSTRELSRPDPERVRAARIRMLDQGQTARDWADANGEPVAAVYKALSGKRACAAGAQRRVAIKLGIVDGAPR